MGSWQAWTSCEHDVFVPKSTLPWLILILPMKLESFQINSDYFIFVGNSLSLEKFFSLQFYSKADKWGVDPFVPWCTILQLVCITDDDIWLLKKIMEAEVVDGFSSTNQKLASQIPNMYIYINRFQTPCLTKERVFFKLSKAWSSWPMQTPFTKHNTQPLAVMTEYGQRGASMAGWHSTDVMIKCPKLHSWIHSIQRISVKALNPTKLCCNPKRLSKDCPWLGYHDITYATCVFLFETSVNLDHTLPGSSFLAPHALLAARWSKGGDWGR